MKPKRRVTIRRHVGWLLVVGLGLCVQETVFAQEKKSQEGVASRGAGDPTLLRALEAADAKRVRAFIEPSRKSLETVLSRELRYAHSNGVVDTRDSLAEELLSAKTRYLALDYEQREFTFPVPGMALMVGRVRIQAQRGETKLDAVLSFLGVWRLEAGQWRFLAWQSCRLP